jgi:carbon storage regulator
MIGQDVEVVVTDIRGNKVRLGISAPKNIPVHRKEVYEAIKKEKLEKNEDSKNSIGETAFIAAVPNLC